MNQQTYLTTEELAALIKYDARTIRDRLKDAVLFEGIHYIRPFGGRKILFIREAIERDIGGPASTVTDDVVEQTHRELPATNPSSTISSPVRTAVRKRRADVDMIPMAGGGVCHV